MLRRYIFTWSSSLALTGLSFAVPVGPRQAKKCLRACAKSTGSDSPHACAKSHSDICSPLIHSNLMILYADNEGPNQTARMRSLIWTFAVRICPKTLFCMEWSILFCLKANDELFMQGCAISKFYYLSTDKKMVKIHLSNQALSYFLKETAVEGTH